jgi:hypothetical protein
MVGSQCMALFGYVDKPAKKHCWLICCERKILFQLKKMNYKPDEQGRWRSKWVLMLYH